VIETDQIPARPCDVICIAGVLAHQPPIAARMSFHAAGEIAIPAGGVRLDPKPGELRVVATTRHAA
jgi:hypothetical protein